MGCLPAFKYPSVHDTPQVTWEERWHQLLSEMEVDVGRRCVTLRAEAERIAAAATTAVATVPAAAGPTKHAPIGPTAAAATTGNAPARAASPSGNNVAPAPAGVVLSEEARAGVLAARYATLMSPVVHTLEKALRGCGAMEPETPAEVAFAQEVGVGVVSHVPSLLLENTNSMPR